MEIESNEIVETSRPKVVSINPDIIKIPTHSECLELIIQKFDKGPFLDGSYEREIPPSRGAPGVIITYSPSENKSREFVVSSVRICTDPHTILKA